MRMIITTYYSDERDGGRRYRDETPCSDGEEADTVKIMLRNAAAKGITPDILEVYQEADEDPDETRESLGNAAAWMESIEAR